MKTALLVMTLLSSAAFGQDATIVRAISYDEDYFSACLLDNMKPGIEANAAGAIRQACRHKATPKRCRSIAPDTIERHLCIDACTKEGYMSRRFGDCSPG